MYLNFILASKVDDPLDTEILSTAAPQKPGTSLRTQSAVRTSQTTAASRPRTSTGRPITGMVIKCNLIKIKKKLYKIYVIFFFLL